MPGEIYEVGPFAALGCAFRVTTESPAVAEYLRGLFRHLSRPAGNEPERRYRLERTGSIPALIRGIDDDIIAHSPRLLLHAAGATHSGVGLAFPARSGTGKSTLVAGLVRAGFGYLTDEFVSPDWDTGEIVPYPRAISLDPGVWEELADLEPSVPPELEPLLASQWQVDPDNISYESVAGPCRLGYVIFPRYDPGAATELRPLRRAEALVELANYTFHFHDHGRRALDVLAAVIGDSECCRLTVGDLSQACGAVLQVVGASVPAGAR